ncbi:MAG: PspA/IM30 family protein [Sphingorhabdus sp.]
MAEPFYMRAKRVVSAGIETALDKAERASGTSLMREAIREVDREMEKVRGEHDGALDRQNQAVGQQKLSAERAEEWGQKALFTLEKGRDDLAEAATMQQMDFEAKIKHFRNLEAAAKIDAGRLGGLLEDLDIRRTAMQEELAIFEKMMSENRNASEESRKQDRKVDQTISRAEETFDRSLDLAGGVNGTTKQAADIGELQRRSEVEERLAAMKKSLKSKGRKSK